MGPDRLARWLFCAVASAAAHWHLLQSPEQLLATVPALWPMAGDQQTTTTSTVDWKRSGYSAEKMIEEYLKELDARRTTYDRVMVYVIVFLMWGSMGVMLYVSIQPLRPCMDRCCSSLFGLVGTVSRNGGAEVVAYVLAYLLGVQAIRYPPETPDQDSPAELIAMLGGLAFFPCWFLSTWAHARKATEDDSGRWLLFQAIVWGGPIAALQLGCLALLHKSIAIGFLAVLAGYSALVCVLCWLYYKEPGFDLGLACRCMQGASVLLRVGGFVCRQAYGPAAVRPFVGGLALCGHAAFLLAAVLLSSKWRETHKAANYYVRQMWVVVCLISCFVTWQLYSIPAMGGTAFVFTFLWLILKEFEWDVNFGVKLLAGYMLLQYTFVSNFDLAMAIFDHHNLYD